MSDNGSPASYIKDRKKVSELVLAVLTGKMTVLEALKEYPKNLADPTLGAVFHALVHFEADEDLRTKDSLYRDEQDSYLEDIANILAKGESLPFNIIDEYDKYHKESLIYPNIDKKTVFDRLKKMINL